MSKHLDLWLSVNLFARGGAYDTFPLAFDDTCTKACMTKVTPKLEYTEVYIINVVSSFLIEIDLLFNTKILHQNAPTLPFK